MTLRRAIQSYPDELTYVNAMLLTRRGNNSFLEAFFMACLRADGENYQIIRPGLLEIMQKYPARPQDLNEVSQ